MMGHRRKINSAAERFNNFIFVLSEIFVNFFVGNKAG